MSAMKNQGGKMIDMGQSNFGADLPKKDEKYYPELSFQHDTDFEPGAKHEAKVILKHVSTEHRQDGKKSHRFKIHKMSVPDPMEASESPEEEAGESQAEESREVKAEKNKESRKSQMTKDLNQMYAKKKGK